MNLKLTYLPLQINGKIRALIHFHFLVIVEAPLLASFGTLGPAEQQYCHYLNISPAIFCQTTLRDSGVIHLLNKLLNLLQIQGFAPFGFSQQYETQQDIPEKVYYVEGA